MKTNNNIYQEANNRINQLMNIKQTNKRNTMKTQSNINSMELNIKLAKIEARIEEVQALKESIWSISVVYQNSTVKSYSDMCTTLLIEYNILNTEYRTLVNELDILSK